jgi:hypothetical protein
VSQFHIVPDVLPTFAPTMDVQLFYKPERLMTIVVMDSDVPLLVGRRPLIRLSKKSEWDIVT